MNKIPRSNCSNYLATVFKIAQRTLMTNYHLKISATLSLRQRHRACTRFGFKSWVTRKLLQFATVFITLDSVLFLHGNGTRRTPSGKWFIFSHSPLFFLFLSLSLSVRAAEKCMHERACFIQPLCVYMCLCVRVIIISPRRLRARTRAAPGESLIKKLSKCACGKMK
jgi:hypothetical protein